MCHFLCVKIEKMTLQSGIPKFLLKRDDIRRHIRHSFGDDGQLFGFGQIVNMTYGPPLLSSMFLGMLQLF